MNIKKIKVRYDNAIVKFLRTLQFRGYLVDLKHEDLTDLSLRVVYNGERDLIKIKLNTELYFDKNEYRYNLYQADKLIMENETDINIVNRLKNYLFKFERLKNKNELNLNDKKINLYSYADKICKQAKVDFNIPIEFLESDVEGISFVVSNVYGAKSIIISKSFVRRFDEDTVFNTLKVQILRYMVSEKGKDFKNSSENFKDILDRYSLNDVKTYAKIRRVN